jgi:hypothetical protein
MDDCQGIDFLACFFLVDDEHVCEATGGGAVGDGLEGEVGAAAGTEGAPREDVEEVTGKDVGWTAETWVVGGGDEEFWGGGGVGEERCKFIVGQVL